MPCIRRLSAPSMFTNIGRRVVQQADHVRDERVGVWYCWEVDLCGANYAIGFRFGEMSPSFTDISWMMTPAQANEPQ